MRSRGIAWESYEESETIYSVIIIINGGRRNRVLSSQRDGSTYEFRTNSYPHKRGILLEDDAKRCIRIHQFMRSMHKG